MVIMITIFFVEKEIDSDNYGGSDTGSDSDNERVLFMTSESTRMTRLVDSENKRNNDMIVLVILMLRKRWLMIVIMTAIVILPTVKQDCNNNNGLRVNSFNNKISNEYIDKYNEDDKIVITNNNNNDNNKIIYR